MSNVQAEMQAHLHLATAAQRFNYDQPYLNQRFPDVVPEAFQSWLEKAWAGIP